MISVLRLEALAALARHGTISAAAQHLGYGQPTVSHHLARLEVETHSVLLQRVGRGVRLTPDGRRLAERAEEILTLLHRAEDELAAAGSLRRGTIRLAAFPSAAATLVPALVGTLREDHPGLELRLLTAEPPEALDALRRGTADVALTFQHHLDDDGSDCQGVDLFEDPIRLITPSGRGPGTVSGHATSRWIVGCERCSREQVRLCAAAGFAPDVMLASDDYVTVQHLVAAGAAVSTLPQLALDAFRHPGIRVHPVPGEVRRIRAVTLGRPPHPPGVAAVLAALAALAALGHRRR